MKTKILSVFFVILISACSVAANGTQDYGTGPGTRSGSGQGRGNGQGLRDGSGHGAGGGQGQNQGGGYYSGNILEDLETIYGVQLGSGVLSEDETKGLLLMVEEEKLARDVYIALYQKWNIPVFRNIAESEQQHMDAVKLVLGAYKVDLPTTINSNGVFNNKELQDHYDNLVNQGLSSLEEALKVGATIEDLDIADLQRLIESADNDEVKILYQNLMKGSRNHIRSFTAQLDRYGQEYSPVFISKEYYEKILKYNHETAPISDPDYQI